MCGSLDVPEEAFCGLQSPAKDQEGLRAVPAPLSLHQLGPPLHEISLLQHQGRFLPGILPSEQSLLPSAPHKQLMQVAAISDKIAR